jgi:uncharacterized integral membrane protein
MKFFRWIAGSLVALGVILFAVANTQTASVTWSPLHPDIAAPLSLICLSALVLGFVMGGFLVWVNEWPGRRERRRQKKYIRSLETEIEKAESAPAKDNHPSVPPAHRIAGPGNLP